MGVLKREVGDPGPAWTEMGPLWDPRVLFVEPSWAVGGAPRGPGPPMRRRGPGPGAPGLVHGEICNYIRGCKSVNV